MAGRYERQIQVFGEAGQRALRQARVGVVGCGGLGGYHVEALVRMGVGLVRFADFDVVAESNLHRQVLFGEADVGRSKVAAAAERLRSLNSEVVLDARDERVVDCAAFVEGLDLVLDGSDDVGVRFGLNDACIARNIAFIYGGVAGREGVVLPVVKGGPCLRCLFGEVPEHVRSCSTEGIFPPVVALTASVQVALGVQILCGESVGGGLWRVDGWTCGVRRAELAPRKGCRCHE